MSSVAKRLFAVAVVVVACSGASTTDTGTDESQIAFPGGNNQGYCASNPSAECSQGQPVAPKQLIFTFDDGPGSRTSELSSFLSSQGVRATFFVLAQYVGTSSNPILSQLRADGHLVGNHTFDHPNLTTLSDSQIVSEVSRADAIIAPWVDQSHFVFRAPYGFWSSRDYTAIAASAMNKYVGPVRWDIGGFMTSIYAADWDCWQNQNGFGVLTSKQCGDRYLRQIADVGRGIVIFHDQDYGNVANHNLTSGQGNTIDMVKYMVPILKQQGYSFLRVDEVPDIAAQFGATPPPPPPPPPTDAGACAFNPTWQQGSGANEWWIEYQISGSVASASLEIVGGPTTILSPMFGKWVAGPNARIPAGTTVVVHATNTAGQTAQTQPFSYLVTTNPVTGGCGGGGTPDAGGGTPDAGGGGGGACAFDPTWSQGGGANNWWVEYTISASGVAIANASLQVAGGQTVALSSQWGKWVGLASTSIASGASVVARAQDTSGRSAQTVPFGYLSVTNPSTQGCP